MSREPTPKGNTPHLNLPGQTKRIADLGFAKSKQELKLPIDI